MSTKLRDTDVDHITAGLGGGAIALSALLQLTPTLGPPAVVLHLLAALLLAGGLVALALGIPAVDGHARRPGVLGSSIAVRYLVVVSAGFALLLYLVSALPYSWGIVFPGPGYTTYLPLVLLVVAAVLLVRDTRSTRYPVVGIGVLAALGLLHVVLDVVIVAFAGVLSALAVDGLQVVATPLYLFSRVSTLATVAVGVWFAWPWLAPHVDAATAAARRARQSHVDSTP
ncbi:hypothetical protein EDF46_2241 [Frondihabitans sp. PhB188]|uniref:hypothetical protein n=1 Tax=Frondihabitans sp. PhB188 TaxID=2485200 RepID=UPI000F46E25F|nr:hypothetical protein [Frondihabitans sp. PhB188]ROQ38601.1 hypothetical protein EDF46_2241 [Frondihabitans sp. PhB188]